MYLDLAIFDSEQDALAKITEAVAKVYFDNVLRKGYDIRPISEAYAVLFALCPNYRLIVQDRFEKYKHLNPVFAEITSLPINSKPRLTGALPLSATMTNKSL